MEPANAGAPGSHIPPQPCERDCGCCWSCLSFKAGEMTAGALGTSAGSGAGASPHMVLCLPRAWCRAHPMGPCTWQQKHMTANSHFRFHSRHVGFLNSGVQKHCHAAAKQTARIWPWKESINCFAGSSPNSKLYWQATDTQAPLKRRVYKSWGCFTAPYRAQHMSPGQGCGHQQHRAAALSRKQRWTWLCLRRGD